MIRGASKASTENIVVWQAQNRPGFSLDNSVRPGNLSFLSQQSQLAQRRATEETPHRNGDFR